LLAATTCDPALAGTDTLFLQTAAGCDSLVITELTFTPTDTTLIGQELCAGEVLIVNGVEYNESRPSGIEVIPGGAANGCDSVISVSLSFLEVAMESINSTLCPGEFILVNGRRYDEGNPAGTEVIADGGVNGCDSIVQVALTYAEGVLGFLEGGRAACPGQTVELTLRLQGANAYNVNITDGSAVVESFTGITGDVSFTVSPSATTDYKISLLTAVGSLCPVEIGAGATVTVVQTGDIQAEVLTDYGGFGASCSDSEDASIGVSPAGPGLSFLWSTGQTTPTLENIGAGAYTVTVTSTEGCSAEASAVVTAPAPLAAKASGIGVDCFSAFSGSILVENLEGGAGPYEYSLDGQFFAPLGALPAAIPGLEAGQYTLYLQDANDCRTSLTAAVAPFEGLVLELGTYDPLKLGDSLQLRPFAGFDVAGFSWAPLTGIPDPASFTPYVRPMETTVYTLTAVDSAGCTATDRATIIVEKGRGLYAPSAFSPNEDGRNDRYTLFTGPDVAEIKIFRIFDRWGNLVFESTPFEPNIEDLGWDGTFNGEPMDPAVFVFYAEVEYVDGFTEVAEGDFVLLR
ncbi:MAG: T9SS type B sorting domain-containing protein, partial [Phaeodactylibacter sp.]|nr:T9SS type B sorting domain-containing protein [Phaeodactylibacter sp.]